MQKMLLKLEWKLKHRDAVNEEYIKVYGGNSVQQDKKTNLFIEGQPMNVLRWALEEASRLRGKEGGL